MLVDVVTLYANEFFSKVFGRGFGGIRVSAGARERALRSNEHEWRPLIRMRKSLSNFQHRLSYGRGSGASSAKVAIKAAHELCGAGIVCIPEAQQQGSSAGLKQPASQSNQLIARCNDVQALWRNR